MMSNEQKGSLFYEGFQKIKGIVEKEIDQRASELSLGKDKLKDVKEKLEQEMLRRHKIDTGIWQMEREHVIKYLNLESLSQWEEATREIRREKVTDMWNDVPERPEISTFEGEENERRKEF